MFDNSALELFILGVILGVLILILIKCFGVIKLRYLNFKWLYKFKESRQGSDDLNEKEALTTIINYCQSLNSKWLLDESDLHFSSNAHQLIKKNRVRLPPQLQDSTGGSAGSMYIECFYGIKKPPPYTNNF